MLKAVLFDLDGVLIDSVKLHCRSYIIAMEKFGLEPNINKIRELMGEKAEVIIAESSNKHLTEDEIREIVKEKTVWYRKELLREKPVRPGAAELLRWCKEQGLRLGLATGTRRVNVEAFIELLGFNPFDAVITANDVKEAKPDPEVWEKTMNKLGVKPGDSIAIDDAVLGVEAAKKAGVRVIGFVGTFDAESLKKAGADWTAKDFEEVKKIIISNM